MAVVHIVKDIQTPEGFIWAAAAVVAEEDSPQLKKVYLYLVALNIQL